jgi:hypothetical protein
MPLDAIVEAAVERSRSSGQPLLGLAVRRLYQESQFDPALSIVMTAILSQSASPEQRAAFAVYIKKVKKQLKIEDASARRLQKSLGTSSTLGSSNSTIETDYSVPPTIGSPGSRTPPHPPPSLNFYPFPASVSTFRPPQSSPTSTTTHQSSLQSSLRSTTPPYPPLQHPSSHLTNGVDAGAVEDEMVSTRRQVALAETAAGSTPAAPIPATTAPTQPTDSSAIVTLAATRAAGSRKMRAHSSTSRTPHPASSGETHSAQDTATNSPATDGHSPRITAPTTPPATSIEVIDDTAEPTTEPSPRRKTRHAKAQKIAQLDAESAATPLSSPKLISSSAHLPAKPSPRRSRRKSAVPATAPAAKASRTLSAPPAEFVAGTLTSEDETETLALKAPEGSGRATTTGGLIRGEHQQPSSSLAEEAVDSEGLTPAENPTSLGSTPLSSTSPPADTSQPTGASIPPHTRSGSVSSLSDIDENLIDEGPPPDSPPRAAKGRGSNTRLTITQKGKQKKPFDNGIGSKQPRGGKRAAAEADIVDEETANKRQKKLEEFQTSLSKRKATYDSAVIVEESAFRFDPDYEHNGVRNRTDESRNSSVAPATEPLPAPTLSTTRATLDPVGPSRRTRGPRQQHVDPISANAPNFSAGPSTPRSDRGEPATKKRKGARTKTS